MNCNPTELRNGDREMIMTPVTPALRALLADARACQWEKSRRQVRRVSDDEGGKPVGAPKSDPTADAALDPVRLDLRKAVRHAEQMLIFGGPESQQEAYDRLERALDRWAGHR